MSLTSNCRNDQQGIRADNGKGCNARKHLNDKTCHASTLQDVHKNGKSVTYGKTDTVLLY